jgi:inner membrane protein involved in colicin E2 resistance
MKRHIGALAFIFVCTSLAWIILGSVTSTRTYSQDATLRKNVGQLWGTTQRQHVPTVYRTERVSKKVVTFRDDKRIVETVTETERHSLDIESSDISVELQLEHRKKGLLWYPTYVVDFLGKYTISNDVPVSRSLYFEYSFPTVDGVYDNFTLSVDGEKVEQLSPSAGKIVQKMELGPHEVSEVIVSYGSQGMDEWWYMFGSGVSHIRNFRLTMITNFDDIDFPENGISPTEKNKLSKGWELSWHYDDLISGIQIGLLMSQKVNPGPFVSKVTFYAPISLFLFLFLLFMITSLQERKIHPMNFFFISAAYFSFHLLLAYLADHVDIHLALLISSAVSIFLVISYMRLVIGTRFALLETGLSQFVYLVLFSYTFFLSGYTGLAITILCILTLFIIMQLTGRVDWSKQLTKQ